MLQCDGLLHPNIIIFKLGRISGHARRGSIYADQRSRSGTGSGFNATLLKMVKTAALAPMPSASASVAAIV